ncbi:MAG: 4-hydroxybenzoate octaprenyltransferase [Gammaproteobacteria bacterium]|nr:4-hydroxybenzoate octaprenyltransferase [Gammaproteobacteria bacterium]MDP2139578.1 4-hydroxybenzoate octaprenyltransferase [Gammaproteobacteria bacterium]MDP2346551.1 4-hydroxybenzoate octaprenyltransferase [Gammaproteobacteria bacterium]
MQFILEIKAKLSRWLSTNFPKLHERLPAFVQLTRLDRPIGVYLLLWPTLSALWIAAQGWPDLHLLLIFVLGTWLMRSAGCAINDFADSNFDGSVLRTRNRPIISGRVKRHEALITFAVLCAIAFILLLFTNTLTIQLSFFAVFIAALYPFMKRFTNLPQVVLGIAFSCGILMAFTAQLGELPPQAWLLFVANCLWTVAYDTQYAMVDREYDLQIGVKSTAILFGDADKVMIGTLQGMFVLAMLLAAAQLDLGLWFYLGLLAAVGMFVWQQRLIRDREPDGCFRAFLNNHWVGAAIFGGIFLHFLFN